MTNITSLSYQTMVPQIVVIYLHYQRLMVWVGTLTVTVLQFKYNIQIVGKYLRFHFQKNVTNVTSKSYETALTVEVQQFNYNLQIVGIYLQFHF